MENHFPWAWILLACSIGGCLGLLIDAMLVSSTMRYLKHWNRNLQRERDDAVKDAKNYRELLKVE